jgi:hypothetical protein
VFGVDLSRPPAGKTYFKLIEKLDRKFHIPSLVIINTTTAEYYNISKGTG